MSDTTLGRCGACTYWEPILVSDLDGEVFHAHVGQCKKIQHMGMTSTTTMDQMVAEGKMAATCDGENYLSDLLTQRTFGCTLFEVKE